MQNKSKPRKITEPLMKKIVSKGRPEGNSSFSQQFAVGPSLPPFVEGQLRCFLHLCLGEIKWMTPRLKDVKIGVKWWGQQSTQIFLQPNDSASADGKLRNEVKFPVRSGPKQFTAYLKDMGTLSLDVLASGEKIGQVDVEDIGLLCQSRPIEGFFPILVPGLGNKKKEIGVVFVSLQFTSISGSFNMTSSTIPTVDMPGLQHGQKIQAAKRKVPKAVLKQIPKPGDQKKRNVKEVKISSFPPERIEYSLQSLEEELHDATVQNSEGDVSRNSDEANIISPRKTILLESNEYQENPAEMHAIITKQKLDAISPILDKDDMKKLEKCSSEDKNLMKSQSESSSLTESSPDERGKRHQSSGNLIKDILDQIESTESMEKSADSEAFAERALVDLVTGEESRIENMLQRLDSNGSLSNEISDIDDPLYDDSLMEDLFYTKKDLSDSISLILTDDSDEELPNKSVPENSPQKTMVDERSQSRNRSSRKKQRLRHGGEVSESNNPNLSLNQEVGESHSLDYIDPKSEEKVDNKSEALTKQLNKLMPEGLDLDRITILARAHFARVVVRALQVDADVLRQHQKCTFFIEYEFPVNSLDSKGNMTGCTEMIRCASNKLSNEGVLFNHRSIFPIHFDADTLVRWWDKELSFNVYVRSTNAHRPMLMGRADTLLRLILLEADFLLDKDIPVLQRGESAETISEIGKLQISVELGCEKSDLKKGKLLPKQDKPATKPAEQPNAIKIVSYAEEPKPRNQEQPVIASHTEKLITKPIPVEQDSSFGNLERDDLEIELHSLLLIPEGRGISLATSKGIVPSCNPYLVCRLIWHEVTPRSEVAWNTVDPKFDFCQVVPVCLNSQLLQKVKDNFMVIEIWHKQLTAESDKLIGIVKVGLHPLYLSFKDQGVTKTLLTSQYPVVAVDGWVEVRNLFDGSTHGHLRVTLALGSPNQVRNLLKMKNENPVRSRDSHQTIPIQLDPKKGFQNEAVPSTDNGSKQSMEHIFGVSIETAKAMIIDSHSDYGEKDCFVQYQFPVQNKGKLGSSLAWHKTPTTLCISNPVFSHSTKHSFVLPSTAQVQNFLLNSISRDKQSIDAGITFEIWQRSYYPNIRDCLLYKALLPIAKLCAMVTMSKQKEASFQAYQLPLISVGETKCTNGRFKEVGFLNLSINYQRNSSVDYESRFGETRNPCVCISVCILRASGLKACLVDPKRSGKKLRDLDSDGLNAFVRVLPSFLGRGSTRTSQVIARNFAPTFSYHVDFPVSILDENLTDDEYEETSSLAYQLESRHLEIELYHQPSKSSFLPLRNSTSQLDEEVLIGKCKIPLLGLLSRQTGVKGWFPVLHVNSQKSLPDHEPRCDSDEMQQIAGGLEVVIKFANPTDRELVINVARGIGWSPIESLEIHDESYIGAGLENAPAVNAVVYVEKLWMSKYVLEHVARQESQDLENYRVYCRYKFYDKAALSSKVVRLDKISSDLLSANLSHRRSFDVIVTAALSWYLREESFEVQFWLKLLGDEKSYVAQQSRDRLLGSAHVDLSNIARASGFKGTTSGLYPLYRFGADDLGRSCARISILFQDPNIPPAANTSMDGEESLTSSYPFDDVATDPGASSENNRKTHSNLSEPADKSSPSNQADSEDVEIDSESGFKFRIVIDEALHLPKMEGDVLVYAAYQLTPFRNFEYTKLFPNSTKPIWSFEKKEALDPCKITNQKINFKVFRKSPGDGIPDATEDLVIGTAVVDISPLQSGFQRIHGWYNIADFSGECAGQIKIGVIPERPLATSPSSRYFKKELLADKIYSTYPRLNGSAIPFNLDDVRQETEQKYLDYSQPKSAENLRCLESNMLQQTIGDSSKSMLFTKLRDQMGELDSLTSSLRTRFLSDERTGPEHLPENNTSRSHYKYCVKENTESSIHSDAASFSMKSKDLSSFEDYPLASALVGDASHHSSHLLSDEFNKEATISKNFAQTERNLAFGANASIDDDNLSESSILLPNDDDDRIADIVKSDILETAPRIPLEVGDGILRSNDEIADVVKSDSSLSKFGETLEVRDKERSSDNNISNCTKSDSVRPATQNVLLVRSEGTSPGSECHEFEAVAAHTNDSIASFHSVPGERELDSFDDVLKDWENFSAHARISDFSEDIKSDVSDEDDSFGHENQAACEPGGIRRSDSTELNFEPDYSAILPNRQLSPELLTDKESSSPADIPKEISEIPFTSKENSPDVDMTGFEAKDSLQTRNEPDNIANILPTDDGGVNSNSEAFSLKMSNKQRIPNFFMPTEKLADSMRKLRLATSFPSRPKHDQSHEEDASKSSSSRRKADRSDIEQKYNRSKNFYSTKETKPNLNKPPPLQNSEISRIASIFSSKYSD